MLFLERDFIFGGQCSAISEIGYGWTARMLRNEVVERFVELGL